MPSPETRSRAIDARAMFRLPWSMSDNAMTWLEPTRQCNLTCDACFVENKSNTHKSLDQVREELEILDRLRRCDAMLIAGGEPLIHPDIVEIVRLVKSFRWKPVLITNGVRLDRPLAEELKRAGAFGFTLHIDSHQSRPGWLGKTEAELNELRNHYADMLHEIGGLSCAFNVTVFPDTLSDVPDIVRWAVANSGRVHILTLICVRMGEPGERFDYYAGGRKIDLSDMPYISQTGYRKLTTDDIYEQVATVLPDLRFCAYLGGTALPLSLKWVIGTQLAVSGETIGHFGSRSMEIIQNGSHLMRGRYLAYSRPAETKRGKLSLLLAAFDPAVRKALGRYLRMIVAHPLRLLKPINLQSISIVQPVDIMENGEQDTCDSCPNKTLWNGALVSACRLEEYRYYGTPVLSVPKHQHGNQPVSPGE